MTYCGLFLLSKTSRFQILNTATRSTTNDSKNIEEIDQISHIDLELSLIFYMSRYSNCSESFLFHKVLNRYGRFPKYLVHLSSCRV